MALRSLEVDITFDSPLDDLYATDDAVDSIRDSAIDSSDAIDNMQGATEKTSNNMMENFTKVGDNLKTTGKSMSKWLTAPIVGIGTAAVATVSGFDDSMAQVRAISGATGEEFDQLRELAMDLGATTAHSASDAADAMTMLAQAGWDTNQILAGTPEMLTLASASGLELGEAASITTSTMSQFSMEAERAGEVADMFAVASTSADTNVHELGEAMKYAGGVASNMGMDLAQTNAVLATFAQQGLVGSRAGTAFNAMFNDLTKSVEDGAIAIGDVTVEVYDANGAMRDMGSIMADVEKATKDMDGATRDAALQNIFGQQAMQGVNVLLSEGSEKYKELEQAIYDSEGASSSMADDMEDNLAGAFRSMSSAIEGFMIQVGDHLAPIIEKGADLVAELAGKFGELDEGTQKTIVLLGGIVATLGPLMIGFGALLSFIPKAVTGFGLLFSPISLITVGIGALIGVVIALWLNWDTVQGWLIAGWNWLQERAGAVFGTIQNVISTAWDFIVESTMNFWEGVMEIWNTHGEFIIETVTAIFDTIVTVIQLGMEFIMGIFEVAWPIISGIVELSWGLIKGFVQTGIDLVLGIIDLGLSLLKGDWEGAWETIKGIAEDIWNNIVDFFSGIDLYQIGRDILQGLINGIKSMVGSVIGAVKEIGSGIADTFKGFFGIGSPSKLFEGYGIDTMLGYTIGFDKESKNAIEASEKTALDISDAFDDDLETSKVQPQAHQSGGSVNVGDVHITIEGAKDVHEAEEMGRRAGIGFKREIFDVIDDYFNQKRVREV